MLRIALCDDEPFVEGQLNNALQDYSFRMVTEVPFDYELKYFPTVDEWLPLEAKFDLLFLDISLGHEKDGIEEAKKLRSRGISKPIILLTSMENRYKDGYDANVFQYLLKPINREKFFQTMDNLLNSLSDVGKNIEIKYRGHSEFVPIDAIIYIETYR